MSYKGVIFDFNGTLFWDTKYHKLAWDKFLKIHKIKLNEQEKALKFQGKRNTDILKSIFNKDLSEGKINSMSLEKETIYHKICLENKMEYAPGAIKFFKFLKLHHINYTIATSSGWENVDFYLKYMELGEWVRPKGIVFAEGSFRAKPHPDIFLLAISKLQLKPAEIVVFEDSKSGIIAAEQAKVGKIIIVNSADENYDEWPYEVITHFNDVDLALFDG